MSPYQVNAELVSHREPRHPIFLHCLPAFHNAETEYAAKSATSTASRPWSAPTT